MMGEQELLAGGSRYDAQGEAGMVDRKRSRDGWSGRQILRLMTVIYYEGTTLYELQGWK